jgi:hypothetical protein
MSLETIASRLTGYAAKLAKSEAYNIVNDAWTDIRNNRIWSFQLGEDGVASPGVIQAGTVTATLGSPTVTLDATATTALTGLTNPFISQRQFRIQGYSIYNIISLAGSTLTLDRNFIDPAGAGLSYQCYQCYYTAPVADFKRWLDWRDMTNGQWLSIYESRRMVNIQDPKRLYFSFPYWVVDYQPDRRTGTSTPGWMQYELYPNPLSVVSYMRWWLRTYPDLVQPSDAVPYPITDKLLFARARMRAYQWMEANKSPDMARGAGADYKFLTTAAETEYEAELKEVGKKDRDLCELFLSRIPKNSVGKMAYYSSIIGRAYGSF